MPFGTRPSQGFTAPDALFVRGLSDGVNDNYSYGIVAHAGGGQSAAKLLPNGPAMWQIDTVVSNNDSVMLPFANQGARKVVLNNGASTLAIFANVLTNPVTGSKDVINQNTNSSSFTITAGQCCTFYCAKNGTWFANKTA